MMTKNHNLLKLLPGLFSTRSELPFGYGPTARAFIVRASKDANFLVYGSSHIGDYVSDIEKHGGIKHQVLGHRDEASKFCNVLSAPLWSHELERQAVETKGAKVANTFSGSKHVFLKDESGNELFTAYHTPGHTNGSSSYLWNNMDEGFSVLFTGDALAIGKQNKVSAVLIYHPYDKNVEDEANSVDLILKLQPTYIVPALSMDDDNFLFATKDLEDNLKQLRDDLLKQK